VCVQNPNQYIYQILLLILLDFIVIIYSIFELPPSMCRPLKMDQPNPHGLTHHGLTNKQVGLVRLTFKRVTKLQVRLGLPLIGGLDGLTYQIDKKKYLQN